MSSATLAGWKAASIYDPATGTVVQLNKLALELSGCTEENILTDTTNSRVFGGKSYELKLAFFEGQNPNRLLYTEEFDNVYWTPVLVSVTPNSGTSPIGTSTADKLITNTGQSLATVSTRLGKLLTKPAVATRYTFSVFAKKAEHDKITLHISNTSYSNQANVTYSLSTGLRDSVANATGTYTNPSSSIEAVGNGYYRVSLTVTTDTSTELFLTIDEKDTTATNGDGTSGIFIWGAQLETGSSPTTYYSNGATISTSGIDQLETWMLARTPVRAVASGDINLQWYESEPMEIVKMPKTDKRTGLSIYVITMSHRSANPQIFQNQNLLAYLGWEDANANGIVDGWAITGSASTEASFNSLTGVQTIEYTSAGPSNFFRAALIFPIAGITLTFSMHTGGTVKNIGIETQTFTSTSIASSTASATANAVSSRQLAIGATAYRVQVAHPFSNTVMDAEVLYNKFPALTTNGKLTSGTSFMSW